MTEINRNTYIVGTFIAWTIILLLGWIFLTPKKMDLQDLEALQALPAPKNTAELDDTGLKLTSDADINGKWWLVYVGFVSCPDVCPVDLKQLADVLKKLDMPSEKKPVVLFVSVDPERDTLPVINDYLGFFDSTAIGVTGTNAALAGVAKFFGAFYSRSFKIGEKEYLVEAGADMPSNAGMNYTVSHSSRIFVVDPRGNYIGSFSPPHQPDLLHADLKELIRTY